MGTKMKVGAAVIAGACSYETAAIVTGRVPTVTALTRRQRVWVRVAVLAAFTGWLWVHMLREVADDP